MSVASHGFSWTSLYAILASLFLSIALFFLDDAHDLKSDQIVHPQRPIPTGRVTIRQAYIAGIVFLLIGTLFASMLFVYQFAFFIVAVFAATAVVFLKLTSVFRAFLTAFLVWALFPFAAFPDLKIVLFGLITALPHVGGSIAKDFLHSRGDVVQGLRCSKKWSKYLASGAFFSAAAIVWLPRLLNFVSWLYVFPIVFTFASCVVLGVKVLKEDYQKVYVYGGVGMCSALIAFLLGGI